MKRGKCSVHAIDFHFSLTALTDIISNHENENAENLHWKGHCSDSDSPCDLTSQILEKEKLIRLHIRNINIVINGGKLKCSISDIQPNNDIQTNADHEQLGQSLEGEPNQTFNKNDGNNGSQVKRKRGRPKKSAEQKMSDAVAKISVNETEIIGNEGKNETKRYGLRGVKLSEAVMRAEMGSAYNKTLDENNTDQKQQADDKNVNNSSNSTEVNIEDKVENEPQNDEIMETNEINENFDDDVKDADYIDSDFVGYVSEEEDEYEPKNQTKRKFGSVVNGKTQKKRNKIDIGDVNIPKYRKKEDFKKNKDCRYCSKKFFHYIGVEDHVRKYHMTETNVETYLEELKNLRVEKCEICNKTFNNRYHLIEHEKRAHLENTSVKCFKCGNTYKNVQSLKNHIRAVHNATGQTFSCNQCTAKFKWSNTLKQHIEEIHEGKIKAVCQHCGKKFPRQNLLNRHMRIHGTDLSKRLLCKFCGKGFWYEHNLRRHIKVIHGPHEENFHCSYCGKGFNLKSAMVTHVQQVHFNIFPFRCNDCSIGFKRSKLYHLHMVKEHNILDVSTLNTNVRQRFKYGKTEEDLFYCSHCSLSFCYKTKMVEHMHSAHGEDFPYMCTHCNQGFLEKSFLSHHLLKAHNEVMIPDETKEEEQSRFQMVTIDINGEKKDLEVESFNIPQPVFIEKTEEVENIVNVEVKDNQDNITDDASQLFFEVSKGADTIHYVIEQSGNGDPTILPQELANLLLAAEQSLQGTGEEEANTGEIQFVPQDQDITNDQNIDFVAVHPVVDMNLGESDPCHDGMGNV